MGAPLAGKGIVVTRPRELAGGLAARVERAGGVAWIFPAIDIQPPSDAGAADRALARIGDFDFAIFVSPTAAQKAVARGLRLPRTVRAFALGAGTRAELARAGIEAQAPGTRADSESLLQSPELEALGGKRVLLVCGEGGRELLGETLTSRGASVARAELYRRAPPVADPAPVLAAWAAGAIHAVTVTSAEGIANLLSTLGSAGAARLCEVPVFVPHPRVAEAARRQGVREAVVAGPSDDEMLARLVAYFGDHG